MTVTEGERREVERANESGRPPVVFIHGLWLLAGSWDAWRIRFEDHGYATLAPSWPDDPETVAEARANPQRFAGKGVRQITDHIAEVISGLAIKPAIIGHSFGGLITQRLAGQGLARVSVPIDPAPFRGVLPLPVSALKAAFPALRSPANRKRAIMLTFEQFRFAFVNAVSAEEARHLYDVYAVPAPGRPLFQAATANLDPRTEAAVNTRAANRGPMLLLSGQKDNTVPWALTSAAYKRQRRNSAPTLIKEIPGRGHSLVIDNGWPEVADTAMAFVREHQ